MFTSHNTWGRRHWLRMAGGLALAPALGRVFAQDRPIEWVVGYAAGGGSDAVARATAATLGKTLGQTLIINNKPGAATNIAAEYVARSRDAEHILLTADFATLAANPFLFAKLPYDPEKDFKPVGLLARFPLVAVINPQLPARTWSEFAAWARAQPNGVNYASAGIGSPHHLATELLKEKTGINFIHVPYKGAAPALQDLVAGNVSFMLVDTASGNPFVTAGRLRALGVASARRIASLPDAPTLQEQGVADYEAYAWQGLAVPAATSDATVQRLNQHLVQALQSDDVKTRFAALGVEGLPGTPQEMARYAAAERERWGRIIRANNIRID
ncbi:MAG: hypothetical protein GAK30_00768 [Paracidovorax wautersii]|uniref:Tripartite-type tricarboxylate transporter, receptor component TctC n=1 Tax=Paracidovorax wautersii TaxID=1177982 RepID=A0A7V8FR72_9BURK|nr:MAG: hypothetical protein GAK30_00768 [Paracidovorax wautersii]